MAFCKCRYASLENLVRKDLIEILDIFLSLTEPDKYENIVGPVFLLAMIDIIVFLLCLNYMLIFLTNIGSIHLREEVVRLQRAILIAQRKWFVINLAKWTNQKMVNVVPNVKVS